MSSPCLTLSPRTLNRSVWQRHISLPRLEKGFRVWTGGRVNNHIRHRDPCGWCLRATSNRSKLNSCRSSLPDPCLQTPPASSKCSRSVTQGRGAGGTPSPHHLLPVRCSPASPHRPQVTSMAPWATLQCRTGHPPSSTGKGCHPTPAARGIFTTCSSDHVFPPETSQGPKSAAQLLRPCLGPSFQPLPQPRVPTVWFQPPRL